MKVTVKAIEKATEEGVSDRRKMTARMRRELVRMQQDHSPKIAEYLEEHKEYENYVKHNFRQGGLMHALLSSLNKA